MDHEQKNAELHVLGVRHHGPGSAQSVCEALAEIRPDCILVEGPPDADELIPWLMHPAMLLPVALLIYRPDQPKRGTFYPYAVFSPEYQALKFALENDIESRFIDLPQAHLLTSEARPKMPEDSAFRAIAQATGFASYEQWWNVVVEQRTGGQSIFQGVTELMTAMRASLESTAQADMEDQGYLLSLRREAAMRQRIRQAVGGGYERIAIICGAWHAPALVNTLNGSPEPDEELLRELPVVEVEASWVPWTYGRLAQFSGYGAGIASPGWYQHLWSTGEAGFSKDATGIRWLGKVAALLRQEGLDVSPAHVIDAMRLAESLAALRGLYRPGLREFNEAVESVMCGGDHEPMQLINRRLIVGERMGMVPPDGPAVPLQRDLQMQQQRLELLPGPEPSVVFLDLRRDRDLERSHLFHRLQLLEIPWARTSDQKMPIGPSLGTFNEVWQLQWLPELSLRVVEAAMWGNTVRDAAVEFGRDLISRTAELPELTQLIDRVIRADLAELVSSILIRVEELAAASHDVAYMLDTLPYLAEVLRYGGMRQNAEHIPFLRRVFDHLLTRACLGLPAACLSLDQPASIEMTDRLSTVQSVIRLSSEAEGVARWHQTLAQLADRASIHPSVAGRATRLLHEFGVYRADDIRLRMDRALSTGIANTRSNPYPADWLDGFIRDSGLLLVHDQRLWSVVDDWLVGLMPDDFLAVLPLLRRTFATFPDSIRQQLQYNAGRLGISGGNTKPDVSQNRFDPDRAAMVIPALATLLGLNQGHSEFFEVRFPERQS